MQRLEIMNVLLLTLLLSVGMHIQPSTRNLLLFGNGQTEYKEQLIMLKQDSIGMAERDLVIIFVENESEYKK